MYVGMLVMSLGSHIKAVLHISDLRHIHYRVQGQSQPVLQMYKCELKIHCKKGLRFSCPSPGMSLTKHPLAGNNLIFPEQAEFG
jgi:hypothetical protein